MFGEPETRPEPAASGPRAEPLVVTFGEVGNDQVGLVGGKNASLGELLRTLRCKGIRVPDGYATTSFAYERLLDSGGLRAKIAEALGRFHGGLATLEATGAAIRSAMLATEFPGDLARAIVEAYRALCKQYGGGETDVAVRSSATAEDLPEASFAGQQESFLNVRGEAELLGACRRCYASLFTDRAIAYRKAKGFDDLKVALSIGVQKMVRADKGSSGVIFTIDTETGFPNAAIVNAAWGLGEYVVKGTITPDQYTVFKPLLNDLRLKPIVEKKLGSKEKKLVYASGGAQSTVGVETTEAERRAWALGDEDILQLAYWACLIERHYCKPMDIEFAKDGETGELFIVQARPETVQSRRSAGSLLTYTLKAKGRELVSGISVGERIASGRICRVLKAEDIGQVAPGSILVTEMTDPDWVPAMKKVAGIVTDCGGRTCHAAIVSRELGIPAIVGTGVATRVLATGQEATLSCAEGDKGHVYEGLLPFEAAETDLSTLPPTRTRIMLNVGSPEEAFRWWRLPAQGVGLARMEFIIGNHIKIHPMALRKFEAVTDERARREILDRTRGYEDMSGYFVDLLARGIAKIAASQYPHPAIVRLSDFKTNEYANLIGGTAFEPSEENPMLGFRGASRYYSPRYREGFDLECRAIRKVRSEMGFTNVKVMVPFCRTPEEADKVLAAMAENGLKRGADGLSVYVMCEIPSNAILADEFARRFDGFSIGSNDLTQLVLGVDRDSPGLAYLFDERHEAVKRTIREVVRKAHEAGKHVGICGQAPSDFPDFAAFLVECGIDSISLNPDSLAQAIPRIAEAERSAT
ncbi:MAG: phosphoenolpyruvate synthase [Planctomycetota bacterium]|nr:phosphoenolpyruvate synthase [Planctomycetota bacterium]